MSKVQAKYSELIVGDKHDKFDNIVRFSQSVDEINGPI